MKKLLSFFFIFTGLASAQVPMRVDLNGYTIGDAGHSTTIPNLVLPTTAAGLGLTNGSTIDSWGTKTVPSGTIADLGTLQTFTNKTISGSSNTLSNIGNSSLTNSTITINGTSIALGGSVITAAPGTAMTSSTSGGTITLNVSLGTTSTTAAAGNDSRLLYDPVMCGGVSTVTSSTTGVLLTGTTINSNTRYRGEWSWTVASRGSVMLDPLFSINSNRDGKLELITRSSEQYCELFFYRAGGDSSKFWANGVNGNVGTKTTIYQSAPYISLSGTLTLSAGDTLTDGSGASAIVSSNQTTTNPGFRWITGTKWFTTGNTIVVNGTSSAVTVSGPGALSTSADADRVFVYEGSSDGVSYGCAIWNDTSATQTGFVRIDR